MIQNLTTDSESLQKKITKIQKESEEQKLSQMKEQTTTITKMNKEMGSIKSKLKGTKEELERDEEGIKLLQKMVDDRKADIGKLSEQVQSE